MSKHNCGWMDKVNNLALIDFTKTLTFFLVFFAAFKSHAANYEFRAPLAGAIDSSSKILRMRIMLVPYHDKLIDFYERYEKDLAEIAIETIENTSASELSHPNFTEDLASRIRDEFNAFLEKYEGIGGIYALQFSELHLDEKDLLEKHKIFNRKLSVNDARIKDFLIRAKESSMKDVLNSFRRHEGGFSNNKTELDCGMNLNPCNFLLKHKIEYSCGSKSHPCSFSIAGEKIHKGKILFYDGILREANFFIADQSINSDLAKGMLLHRDLYNKIAGAFVENFGFSFGRSSTTTGLRGPYVRKNELGSSFKVWSFGNDEVYIALVRYDAKADPHPKQIEIRLTDQKFYDEQTELEKKWHKRKFSWTGKKT